MIVNICRHRGKPRIFIKYFVNRTYSVSKLYYFCIKLESTIPFHIVLNLIIVIILILSTFPRCGKRLISEMLFINISIYQY